MGAFLFSLCWLALQTVTTASAVPHYFQPQYTRRDLSSSQVSSELGALVSNGTLIYGPAGTLWANATERYNTFAVPDIQVVVQPAQESDIPAIVKYCNTNSIDFFAVNRAHAITASVGKFQGLQIDMASLREITIQPGGETAWFQGGTYDGQVMETLWGEGYVATTGSCSCVGMLGPGLGGGHGRYEGFYGLISDNFVHLNVVLADGQAIRVNSTSHADLFWAMKGAGHNYGIVTSFALKIYPRLVDTWHWHNYIWTQDKLELVTEQINILHGSGSGVTPVEMAIEFGVYMMNDTISETAAILYWTFGYAGSAADGEKALAPFNAIPAEWQDSGDLPYPEISDIQGTGIGGALCTPNTTHVTSTAGLQLYNATAQRQIYELFNEKVQQYPELNRARVVLEGYSTAGVSKIDPASSAFPHRSDHHLTYFDAQLDTGSNLTHVAAQWAKEVVDLWNAGQPTRQPSTYVNYANGFESLESTYGYEPWRLERLRGLKAKYDPQNRFRFYEPIIAE
ncbi:FAD-binding domain-containing protein [Aspergillus ellipticus CBS 707.79]|uniref:FAD-binding domain-containing protein n=1 Tax=Aspergillus ellipticus CBS 707.79 TaxID=1448320 RepID=A0A319CR76_9EURO|nr:FAD-binding domain-containing protein [Aspergillus ellipticus CBS 707.79]